MKTRTGSITALFILALALAAQGLAPARRVRAAALWYVSGWAGKDTNACNTPLKPCRTINAAISKALAGDTIEITADPYTNPGASEVVLVNKSLTLSGGWNSTFGQVINYTILNGEHQRRGLVVAPGVSARADNVAVVWGLGLDGGGVYAQGPFTGVHMLVAQNRAFNGAGYFLDSPNGQFTLINTAIYANEYYDRGGGIFLNDGNAYATNTTISTNISVSSVDEEHGGPPSFGGGVYAYRGVFGAAHTTFAENTVFDGRQTFTTAGAGLAQAPQAWAQVTGTLIADGCAGIIFSSGHNLDSGSSCNLTQPGDMSNTNPQILQADVTGGSTITHALAAASPALDTADPVYCASGTNFTDQRGVPRPQGPGCDIGAFERKPDDPQGYVIGDCPPDPSGVPGNCTPDPTRVIRQLLLPGALRSAEGGLARLAVSGKIAPPMLIPLERKLRNAAVSFADGEIDDSIDQLNAFIRLVNAQRGRKISEGAADNMLEQAQNLIAFLTPADAAGTPGGSDPAGGSRPGAGQP